MTLAMKFFKEKGIFVREMLGNCHGHPSFIFGRHLERVELPIDPWLEGYVMGDIYWGSRC